jgi:hypothetical protein
MRRLIIAGVAALAIVTGGLCLFAQVAPVTVAAVTHTQAVLTYTAPDSNPCHLEVSESASYAPLITDVDPVLFPGSQNDDRAGNIANGLTRTFVVGKYGMSVPVGGANIWRATDGTVYSRALAASTTYYYRLRCGATDGAFSTGSFTTANVPMGLTWQPALPIASPGAYNFPSWPTSRTAPNAVIVDPVTGVKLRPVWMPSDTIARPVWESSALHMTCSPVEYQGGRLCVQPIDGSGAGALYWVHPMQPAKFLGRMGIPGTYCSPMPCQGYDASYFSGDATPSWSTTTWNVWYGVVLTRWHPSACDNATIGCRTALAKFTFTGNLSDGAKDTWITANATLLQTPWKTPEESVEHDWDVFDPRHTSGTLAGGELVTNGVSAGDTYLLVLVRRRYQDSYGMLSAWNVSSGKAVIVGSADVGQSNGSRWCGIHATMNIWDSDPPMMAFRPKGMAEASGTSGPWGVNVWGDEGHTTGLAPGATDVYTSSEAVCLNGNAGECWGKTGRFDTRLLDAAVGDVLWVTSGEWIKIIEKVSSTHWLVQRGYGGLAQTHDAGAEAHFDCEAGVFPDMYAKMGFWSYTADRFGESIQYDASGASNGHMEARPSGRVAEHWEFVARLASTLSATAPTRTIDRAPGFADEPGWEPTNGYPVWSNSEAAGTAGQWFADNAKLTGGASQASDGTAATPVAGFSRVWRFHPDPSRPLSKHYAHFGFVDATPLMERSGPSVKLTDSDVNTFCIANAANECVTGSSAGDVYIVAPRNSATDEMRCLGSYNNNSYGMCVGNVTATVNSVVQVGTAETPSCTGMPVKCGAERLRIVQSLTQPYSYGPLVTGVKPWADGSAIASYGTWGTSVNEARLVLAILPPFPATLPTVPLDTYVQTVVTVPDVSGAHPTVNNAVVKFGYLENGAAMDFYCTARAEACVKGAMSAREFGFATNPNVGVPCARGCSLTLPVLPRRLVYYEIVYRDAANIEVARSPLALTADAATGVGLRSAISSPSGLRIIK